jgi:transcription elongation GreA/GreB family factor
MAELESISKRALLDAVDAQLTDEITSAQSRARAAAASATHEESRPENDKDTRAIEESYLARGQAQRVADLEDERAQLRSVVRGAEFEIAAVGALVALEDEDGERLLFLAPAGGGRKVQLDGLQVQLVTPSAPLGEALVGKEEGDEVELFLKGKLRTLDVVGVA